MPPPTGTVAATDSETLKRLLIAQLLAKRGFFPPPPVEAPIAPPPPPEPTGFGRVLQQAGRGLGVLTSGENAANAIGNRVGIGNIGTKAMDAIERVPLVGRPLGFGADVATSPLTIATAGFGGVLGTALRGGQTAAKATGFGKFLAPIVEPLVQGSLPARVGAEVALSAGAEVSGNVAEAAGLPAPVVAAASLGGGLVGLRTAANVVKNSTRTAGGMLPEQVEEALASGDPVRKFSAVLSSAKMQREELGVAQTAERARRTATISGNLSGVTDPTQRARIIAKGSEGELPKMAFEADMAKIEVGDIAAIRQRTSDYYANLGRVYDERNASTALNKLFTGQIPTPSEIGLLQNALGAEFASTIQNLATKPNLWKTALDLAGVPRAVMSSFDLSIPFRQGAVTYSRPSFWKEFKPMVAALKDETYAKAVVEKLSTDPHPMTAALRKTGAITGLPTRGLEGKEEAFMSTFAEAIPGVRQSERAAVTFLNKLRADYSKDIYSKWERAGAQITQKDIDDLAKWTATVTGRGPLPEGAGALPGFLSSLFFSPRFVSSRLAMMNPRTYMNASPLVRREIARDMASFYGLGIAGVTGLAMAGKAGVLPDVNVEVDPRSSDFGKVRIGLTRLDPWAGFQPYARYAAQFVSGSSKNSAGEIVERERMTTLGSLGRGKLGPIPSFVVDALTGSTFTGQEVDVTTGAGLERAAAERLAPLFLQDLSDAIVVDGGIGALKVAPAALGVGVSTYNSTAAIRNAGALEMYQKPWADLTGKEKASVNISYAEQLAKQQAPASNSVQGFIAQEDLNLRAFEQQAAEALQNGQLRNADFTKGMQEAIQQRVQRVQAVVDYDGTERDPDLLDRYFALRDQATDAAGNVDYQLLDQIQQNFIDALPPEEQRVVTERTSFAHAPEVQWWVDAKKTIQESGYYQTQTQALETLSPLLKALGMEGKTYNQIRASAGTAESPQEIALTAGVLKRVDALTKQLQALQRAKNPDLDKALGLVYGSPSIYTRRR